MEEDFTISLRIIFVRHCHTLVDLEKPSSEWNLSPQGLNQAQRLIFHPILTGGSRVNKINQVICSSEPKTVQSIAPFCDHWHYEHTLDIQFDEVRNISLPTADKQQYFANKAFAFNHRDSFSESRESYYHVLERFNRGIKNSILRFPHGTVIIVTHGTILTLYFAQLQGDLENGEKMYRRWSKLESGAVGVVENGQILQSIHYDNNR
ncbi:MAG: histidine phosphatase family protein [Promethearchaeota archaeon]